MICKLYSGDYDIILDGIHENILQLNYRDPVMQNTVSLTLVLIRNAFIIILL